MRRTIAVLALIGFLASPMAAGRSDAQTNSPNKAEWLVRLNAIRQGDWRTARDEVARLGGLPPGEVTSLVTGMWPDLLVPEVKKEILGALFYAEYPDALRIARIAVADRSPQVWEGLRGLLLSQLGLNFGQDREQTRHWIEGHLSRPYKDVRRNRVYEVVGQLRNINRLSEGDREAFLRQANELWRSPELHDMVMKSRLFTVTRDVLRDPDVTPAVQVSILRVFTTVSPNERYLRETVWPLAHSKNGQVRWEALVTLAKTHYRPAYAEIKAALIAELQSATPAYVQLVQALGNYGDPEAIPFLIGLIAADNNQTIYDVGYFGLGQLLTGAPYSSTHDGNWWRIWWERNRPQLPAGVRDLPIPDFARSRAYQEPMPGEYHLDRMLLRAALLQKFAAGVRQGQDPKTMYLNVRPLAEFGDPAAIPALIGAIAADNSHDAIYNYGYFGLTPLTGVPYSVFHDGNWWKLWWQAHRSELPADIRDLPITVFPRANGYRDPITADVHRSPDAMRSDLLARLRKVTTNSSNAEFSDLCRAVAELNDPRIVPDIIELIPEEPKHENIYWLTYYGIGRLTGVPYAGGHGRAWWQDWWRQNGAEFQKRYADAPKQPDFLTTSYKPRQHGIVPSVTEIGYDPQVSPSGASAPVKPDPDDIKDVRSERFFAKGDKNKLYRLVGLSKEKPIPASGYKLLVLLPGGDGSEDFRWFVQRIKKNALPADVLVAQLVAPKWSEWQAKNLVWPTRIGPFFGMKFPTEQFIDDVIADVGKRTRIDPANVCTLAWSSSGPAAYAHAATTNTTLRGAFIAMSVFRPDELPDPAALRNRRFFIYHSPQDFIPIQQANASVVFLTAHGVHVKMQEYQGGHGWHGDIYKDLREGFAWLYGEN